MASTRAVAMGSDSSVSIFVISFVKEEVMAKKRGSCKKFLLLVLQEPLKL